MPRLEQVTVELPEQVVRQIEIFEKDRVKFVLEAVRREIERRREEGLRVSLDNPKPETEEFAELGFDDWVRSMPEEDAAALVDPNAGTPIRWVPGKGWVEDRD